MREPERVAGRAPLSALVAILAAGAVLRLWQVAAGPSLWLDELALARNVTERGWGELLFRPLDYGQVAPPLFLAAEKAAVALLGPSDLALRLLPLLASLVGLPLLGRLAWRELEAREACLAAALFALAPGLILYGTMVKPYGTDVAVALLLTLLVLRAERRGPDVRSALAAGAAGAAAVWASHPAVLLLAGLGAGLLLRSARSADPAARLRAVLVVAAWATSSVAAVLSAAASVAPETRAYLDAYWAPGFPPAPWRGVEEAAWLWKRLAELVRRGLELTLPDYYVLLAVAGVWGLRCRPAARHLLLPFLATLAAAVARQYPFQGRLLLFLAPALLLCAAAGAFAPLRLARGRWRLAGHLAWGVAAGGAVGTLIAEPPPYGLEPVRELLARVGPAIRPGDAIYVYYGAAQAVRFYGPRAGIGGTEYAEGGCHRGNPRGYLFELDAFRGEPRVWVLLTHASGLEDERSAMRSYLDRIGTRRREVRLDGYRDHDAEAWLYDLSDPSRLDRARAGGHTVPEPRQVTPAYGCFEAPQASAEPDP